jgi:uncharacterized protein YndB with AHSA1/START domain
MRTLLTTISLAVVLAASPSIAQQVSNTPSTQPRVVRVEATINAPVSEVWRVWTTSKGAEEFFAEMANIQLAIGGSYEIQFDPKDERSGTKGLKVLSYAPEEMISFQWNAPPEYPGMVGHGLLFRCGQKAQTGRISPSPILAGKKGRSGTLPMHTSSSGGVAWSSACSVVLPTAPSIGPRNA